MNSGVSDNSDNGSEAPDLVEPGDSNDSESEANKGSNFDYEFTGEEYREALQIVCNLNDIFIVPELEEGVTPSDEKKVDIVSAPKIAFVTPPWNWMKYRHYFLGVGNDKIKKTFDATTQYAPTILSGEKV